MCSVEDALKKLELLAVKNNVVFTDVEAFKAKLMFEVGFCLNEVYYELFEKEICLDVSG